LVLRSRCSPQPCGYDESKPRRLRCFQDVFGSVKKIEQARASAIRDQDEKGHARDIGFAPGQFHRYLCSGTVLHDIAGPTSTADETEITTSLHCPGRVPGLYLCYRKLAIFDQLASTESSAIRPASGARLASTSAVHGPPRPPPIRRPHSRRAVRGRVVLAFWPTSSVL